MIAWIKKWWVLVAGMLVAVLYVVSGRSKPKWAQDALNREADRHAEDAAGSRERAVEQETIAERHGVTADELEAAARSAATDPVPATSGSRDWRDRHREATDPGAGPVR